MVKQIKIIEWTSLCCNAPVDTMGETTMYHVCGKCNKACDVKKKIRAEALVVKDCFYKDGTKVELGDIFEYEVHPEDDPKYMQQVKVIYWADIKDLGGEILNGPWKGTIIKPMWENLNKI